MRFDIKRLGNMLWRYLILASLMSSPQMVSARSSEDCENRTLILHEAINKYTDFEEEKAAQMFEQVLGIAGCPDHESITANQFLGDYYRSRGNPTKMEKYFLAALRIDPNAAVHPIVGPSKPFYEKVRDDNFKEITIETVPDSSEIVLDGEYLGPSPIFVEYLEIGRHVLEARHSNDKYSATVDTLDVKEASTITVQLQTKKVNWIVESAPSAAVVYYTDTDPPTKRGITPYNDVFEWGDVQEIVVVTSGFQEARLTVEMTQETVETHIDLLPLQGQLDLKYRPKDSKVYIDGDRALDAANGRLSTKLPIGVHEIRVVSTRGVYESRKEDVEIIEDRKLSKTIKLPSIKSSGQRALTDHGSTGVLGMNYPYSFGEGIGFNVLFKTDRIEPRFPEPLGAEIGDELNMTFVTTGVSIVGSGNSWLTLGTSFVVMLSSQQVFDESAPEGTSDELKWALKSVSVLKLTFVERENVSWSIQGTLDLPLRIDGYFPGFSHPIFISWDDAPQLDYGGGTSLAFRGRKFEFILNGEYTKYGETAEDLGYSGELISENSLRYNAAIGIGGKNQFFVQFGGEVFDIKDESYIAKSELPMAITFGGRFLTPESVFVLAVGASLVTDDEETMFNPTLVYPLYFAEITIGDGGSRK